MKIAAWNVNSIRARMHAVPDWLLENKIDVLLVQEIKCQDEQFPWEFFEDMGYNCEILGQKSMNGVAILSKFPITDVKKNLPMYDFNDIYNEARYIEGKIEYSGKIIRLCSIYFPNGSPLANWTGIETESPRFSYKLDFFDRFLKYIAKEKEENPDEIFILGGDYNVMHKEIDVYNAKNWIGKIAFMPEERQKISNLEDVGFFDTFRLKNPDANEFSWWNYRFGGFPKNHGLRIDYIFVNCGNEHIIKSATIDKRPREGERASDHVPCLIEISMN